MEGTVFVLMLIMTHGVFMVLLLTYPKSARVSRWFYFPSLLTVWLAYIAYEAIYLPRHCSGECNIRVDLLLIYPYLAFVTICAIAYFAKGKRSREDRPKPARKRHEA
jgi:hypothetical protein